MKRLTTIISAMALILVMVQCRKNVEQIAPGGQNPGGETVRVTLKASCDDGAKTEISEVDGDGIVKWTAGDRLYVVGPTGCHGYLEPVNFTTPNATYDFAGEIRPATSGQTLHIYYFGKDNTLYNGISDTYNYSITVQDGTLAGIAQDKHLMHGTVVAGSDPCDLGDIMMNNMMAIAKFDLSAYTGANPKCTATSSATLDLKTGALTPGLAGTIPFTPSASYYMALIPKPTSQDLVFTQDGFDYKILSRVVSAGKFYTQSGGAIPVSVALLPGTLPGNFTVASGKKVRFSKGNLYWDGTAFKMEANQWDIASSWNTSHVSHFFWSNTTDWQTSGMEPYASSYSSSIRTTSDNFFTNATQTTPNSSFTVEGESNTWRTLSKAEWDYVLNTSGSSGRMYANRFAKAMVHSVKGLAVFPDGYVLPSGYTTSGGVGMAAINTTNAAFPATNIAAATWSSMESAGVVFLPAAGYRNGTTVDGAGSGGLCWSSNPIEETYVDRAYYMFFDSGGVSTHYDNRHYGCCVRLVRSGS